MYGQSEFTLLYILSVRANLRVVRVALAAALPQRSLLNGTDLPSGGGWRGFRDTRWLCLGAEGRGARRIAGKRNILHGRIRRGAERTATYRARSAGQRRSGRARTRHVSGADGVIRAGALGSAQCDNDADRQRIRGASGDEQSAKRPAGCQNNRSTRRCGICPAYAGGVGEERGSASLKVVLGSGSYQICPPCRPITVAAKASPSPTDG